MRWIIGLTLAVVLFGTSAAWAASAYDDVKTDHWAYNALDYLTERGVLEGYPDGFFKGDRTLTRYEFAQAVARLLDTIDATNPDEQIRIMAETLRAEFSDQLSDLTTQLGTINAAMGDMEGRVADLEGNVADTNTRVGALEEKVGKMQPGADWKGTFRYRWQYETRDTAATNDRFRQRIQFALGYNRQVNQHTQIGFRLKTETGDTPTSGNFTLGRNNGETADIFLDRAYVKYSPTWFGYYTDDDCDECTPRMDIYAGIFPQINKDPNEAILDDDVNLQGLGVVYHFNRDFQILTAISVEQEVNSGSTDDDAILSITELRYDDIFGDDCDSNHFDVWAGCYCWLNESALPDDYFRDNQLWGFDFNNNGTAFEGGDRFASQFKTAKIGAQYTWDCAWGDEPLSVYAEYLVNTDSDAEDRINIVNPFITPDIVYETTDDTGFVIGTQWGDKPTCVGDWYWFARYKEIGANAVVDGFADADSGGANTNSFEAHASWMWMENSLFGITYFLNKMHNAFGFLIPAEKADQQIVQVDWTFRF
jgi:hypothetical protein